LNISPLAGRTVLESSLIDVAKLVAAYYSEVPDPMIAAQRVSFGTSGHRGSASVLSFNEWHVLSIAQAICNFRKLKGISGPLFMGFDTHALSQPAWTSALEVLAANGVDVMLAVDDEYTPTPAISHAIVTYNRRREVGFADGIVVTPSHNPPRDGGFKYNPPDGGPAGDDVTRWIEAAANHFLETRLEGVRRVSLAKALHVATTHRHDFLNSYVNDLGAVIDMDLIRAATVRMGVDPLGGAGVHYWPVIAERYGLDLAVFGDGVDPTFRFMTLDWDGQIRMDPSSMYSMKRLVQAKDRFDIAFACDTDHDRHGIVTRSAGLLPANHYLSVAIDYLFSHRPQWSSNVAVGKTVVSTQLIDRLVASLGRTLFEVPVGFKWFARALHEGTLGFAGEERAGATFSRRDGKAWTTDKDGIVAALLAAEIIASTGRAPGTRYGEIANEFGNPVAERIDAPTSARQKKKLSEPSREQVNISQMAGERVEQVIEHAPGNDAAIGGIKVVTKNGWFAARPSGTEDIYKIYAESFSGCDHLKQILVDAQSIVDAATS
jgi:phosphoglucomutase